MILHSLFIHSMGGHPLPSPSHYNGRAKTTRCVRKSTCSKCQQNCQMEIGKEIELTRNGVRFVRFRSRPDLLTRPPSSAPSSL